jgi:2-hydroxychromene-2-carboxylate isomerase
MAEPERRFYFDLASPECWLVAERILHTLPQPCEWVPVHVVDPVPAFRCAEESDIWRLEIERRARSLELQAVRWPASVPFDSEFAMRCATYARGAGKAVAFALAAFRQAYCAGRDLGEPDNVMVAAAACELHPRALQKGVELRSTADALEAATASAPATVPAIAVGDAVFSGEDAPELAIAALAHAR